MGIFKKTAYEVGRAEAVEEVAAKARELAARHGQAHAAAKDGIAKARAALKAAEQAHLADPSEGNLRAIFDARDELTAATRAHDDARDLAERSAAGARAAEARLREAQREARKAELRPKASLEAFQSATAKAFATLLECRARMLEAAATIDRAWNAANDAAIELSRLGEHTPELGSFHLIGPLVLAHADTAPERLGALIGRLHELGWGAAELRGDRHIARLSAAVFNGIFTAIEATKNADTHPPDFKLLRSKLAAMLTGRTLADAQRAAVDAHDQHYRENPPALEAR